MKSVEEKWSQKVLLCADLVTPRQRQGQWKWYKKVDVNGAYRYSRHDKFGLREEYACNVWFEKLVRVMSKTNVFAM